MYQVLIVDDDLLMRKALGVMLSKSEGFEVAFEAMTGEEAVEFCVNNTVDIIFMDIIMPGMSGIEASKKILEKNSEITIYIISAYTNFYFAKEALKTQVKEYIYKPLSSSYLKELLENYRNEHESSVQNQVNKLVIMSRDKDFFKMYYSISEIIDEIYVYVGKESEKLIKAFIFLGQSLINILTVYNEDKVNINDLFPINTGLIDERKVMEIWLFQIMNYVFQQNSIQRYSFLKLVFEYIDDHIKEEIGLQEITNNCAVSQGYLSRIFKEQFKISVMEYLHMRKLNIAKGYFALTDESMADVAFKLGYNESSYFSKVFKKYENLTVQQYKNLLENSK